MTLREVAERIGGRVAPEHYDTPVTGVASLTDAAEGDISFYGNPKYLNALRASKATAVLVPQNFSEELSAACIWVEKPAEAFAQVLLAFAPAPIKRAPGIHPTAIVAADVSIGAEVHIGPYVVIEAGTVIGDRTIIETQCSIGHGTRIGSDCHFFPRVTVTDRCLIKDRVILHPGVVIGSDGFGYEFRDGGHQKIPQTGIVQIDNDVEIGSNSTVDRARFGRTWIQSGVKIDNLVQIAHNVIVGPHTILCAQVGISGSTRVGTGVTLAGKVGVNGHIEIGDGAIVTAMAGITKTVKPKEILVGLPAKPMKEYKENYVFLRNIRKLYDRVRILEEKLGGE